MWVRAPRLQIIKYNINSYIANHYNILNTKKLPRINCISTKKSLRLISSLYSNRIIQAYTVSNTSTTNVITFNSRYFRGVPYFGHFKIISTPSKVHSISASGIRIISKSIGNSVLLVETDKGIINHLEAIKYNIGGKLLAIIS